MVARMQKTCRRLESRDLPWGLRIFSSLLLSMFENFHYRSFYKKMGSSFFLEQKNNKLDNPVQRVQSWKKLV